MKRENQREGNIEKEAYRYTKLMIDILFDGDMSCDFTETGGELNRTCDWQWGGADDHSQW